MLQTMEEANTTSEAMSYVAQRQETITRKSGSKWKPTAEQATAKQATAEEQAAAKQTIAAKKAASEKAAVDSLTPDDQLLIDTVKSKRSSTGLIYRSGSGQR